MPKDRPMVKENIGRITFSLRITQKSILRSIKANHLPSLILVISLFQPMISAKTKDNQIVQPK